MKQMRPYQRILICLTLLVLVLTGCAPQAAAPNATGQEDLKGTIAISGAFALYPMMQIWGQEFQKLHPGVQFDISAGGAGKGMADALGGAVDIGMVSRAITSDEEAKGAFWLAVTKDAVVVVVNEKNPVWDKLHAQGITRQNLIDIYITGKITTWGQLVGNADVTDPIHVFTRSDAAGAPDTIAKYMGKAQENLLGVGVFGDPGILDAVVKDPLGIGYNNMGYAYDANTGQPVTGAKVLPIDVNGNGKVDPEENLDTRQQLTQAILNGKYPSPPARDENLVTKGKPSGLTAAFIEWILGDGQKFIEENGYILLPSTEISAQKQKLSK
jgi:phosphate transport system substrate-binding protein